MPTKPDPMSIRTDTLMAQLQTRRQALKHDSLTSIVSTSGGFTAVRPLNFSSCARAGCMQLAGVRFFYFQNIFINIINIIKRDVGTKKYE